MKRWQPQDGYELAGVAVGVGVRVGVGLVRRMVGVGVGCFRRGVTVRIRLKAMLKTTRKLIIPKMIRCALLCERLTFLPPTSGDGAVVASLTH